MANNMNKGATKCHVFVRRGKDHGTLFEEKPIHI